MRADYAAIPELTRTIEEQRGHILNMEDALRKYKMMRGELQVIQDALIKGRVNDAREHLSSLLLKWP